MIIKLKYIVILLTVFIGLGFSQAQNEYNDSLLKLLSKTKVDTAKLQLHYLIAWNYIGVNADSALSHNKKALDLSIKTGKDRFRANVLDEQGYIYSYENEFEKAISSHIEALKLHQKNNYKRGMIYSLNGIGTIFNDEGNHEKALEYYQQALKIGEETNDKKSIFLSLNYIGSVHLMVKKNDQALTYFNKSLKYSDESTSTLDLADLFLNLTSVYLNLGKSDSALFLGNKTLSLYEKINPRSGRVADILNTIGKIHAQKGDYSAAIDFTERSFRMADELVIMNVKIQSSRNLAKYYASVNDFKSAYKYQETFIALNDSSFHITEVAELESKFLKEKEEEIRKKEKEIQEYRERISKITAISITIVLLLVSLVLYLRYRAKQRSNELLQAKNKIIEDKQKEILDSIHYAQRIQKALITSEKYIDKQITKLKGD